MKLRAAFIALVLAFALLLTCASAAGGDASDPLVSLEYLLGVFRPEAEQGISEKIDAAGNSAYETAASSWRAAAAAVEARVGTETASVWTEARLKRGDLLSGVTGTQVILLAGSVEAQIVSGAVVDVTDGTELASGASLQVRHRYLAAEDASVLFSVSSRTAILDYCGGYRLTPSAAAPDYYAIAGALRTLTLFRGTDTGYGDGFDLEGTPTRIQALVMLLRMLGEEDDALACTSPAPFRDISENYWGRAYVAYAFEKGYTNGVEDNLFAPDRPANEGMYVEFMLRALGYSDTSQTDIRTASDRALSAGVITAGERAALRANDFLRADVAYLSWYALETPLPGGGPALHRKLEDSGVFTPAAYQLACSLVPSQRI